ncbi:MAG TPA: hypothetical protein VNQ56_18445 [Pseudolabrys sp.]|nr:hypothetical protein [Pseudolabrys sp.]
MPMLLFPLLVAAPLALQVAGTPPSPPTFNVDVTCRRAAESAVAPGRTSEGCKSDEMTAREAIVKNWTDYASVDRERCARTASLGGPPSYVDLLTCLEMAKSVKSLPKDELTLPSSRSKPESSPVH